MYKDGDELENLNGKTVCCGGRHLAILDDDGVTVSVSRLPACSIGEWLGIITWLRDEGYEVI